MLFIHGAGGYVDDRPLVDGLHAALGVPIVYPEISEDDMSVEAWAEVLRRHLALLGPEDVVVGHSFGATILQWVLPEQEWGPRKAVLLATPDWSPQGWDVEQYVPPGPEPKLEVSLHHCRDDEVVPVEHLALIAARIPSAQVFTHARGGHQFDGVAAVIAADCGSLA